MTFDGDGQHRPEDLPALIRPLLDGEADLVVGQRPTQRRWAERLVSRVTTRLIGVGDPFSGLKAAGPLSIVRSNSLATTSHSGRKSSSRPRGRGFRLPTKILLFGNVRGNPG